MKSVSIYTLTRNQNIFCVQKLERQMSGRGYFLKMREWELDSMKAFVRELETHMDEVYALWFFYSFQIPRLGKEFDLLQIREDQIVNVELKSGAVSDEALRKQLIQNRYYLAVQGKTIRSYTYISSQNRLVRLTNHDRIVDADWEQLCADLRDGGKDYEGDVEELFQAELYLISPLTEPERFLNKEYFLTAQQRDIERQILKKIRAERTGAYWFTGLPGTGKTLLLYDIAMKLSGKQRVCMIHCGESKKDWKRLHERLRRVEYLPDSEIGAECGLEECSAVLVDEAHLLEPGARELLAGISTRRPVIFSGDCEDVISPDELGESAEMVWKSVPGVQTFRMTNRIRTNAELSVFIQNMMRLTRGKGRRMYPHVSAGYGNDEEEAEKLLKGYLALGYRYFEENAGSSEDVERLVVLLDERYFYDETEYLRSGNRSVRRLFHRLNQAKEELAFVVKKNEAVYSVILGLLQAM